MIGAIAGRIDRTPSLVRQYSSTTMPLSQATLRRARVRVVATAPTPTMTKSAACRVPSAQPTCSTRSRPSRHTTRVIADDGDAVRAMLLGQILRDAGRDHAVHDPVGHFKHRDFAAHLAAGRSRLEPDVAAPDDDDARLRFEPRLNGRDIRECTQIVHARKSGPWAGQPA